MGIKQWWFRMKGSPVSDVIKHKHRFVVMDTNTFKEKFSFQLSGVNLFVAVGITIIVLILLTTILIAFTPMREWIPGYTNTRAVEQAYANAKRIDSLEVQLENQEWLIATLQAVLRGEVPSNTDSTTATDSNATLAQRAVVYRRSVEDSLLRAEVEREDNLYQVKDATTGHAEVQPVITHLFFTPVKGNILTPFSSRHQGVDIGTDDSRAVCATYNGTVISSGFTAEGGHVIVIQHPGNVVSIYRHCSAVLKHQGDLVRAGEPIAYAGNSPQQEIGTNLHFELWVNGSAVNPEEYISF